MTEALAHQLIDGGTNVRASVFYPSGGLLDTGLFVAARNRPPELARVHQPDSKRSMTFDELKAMVEKSGRKAKVMDLDVLGRFVIEAVKDDRFIIAYNLEATAELLHRRADAIARAELPPHHQMGV